MQRRNVACGVKAIPVEAVAQVTAAKEAVSLAQARADEVIALGRATAPPSANDLAMFAHANSWHGNLPSETDSLLLERARLSEMEHNRLFDVHEERNDEWQGMHNRASLVSLDSAHAVQGSTFSEDALFTPSEGKIPIAARSLRRDERVAKRMRVREKATKAAAMAAAALAAPPSIRGKSKNREGHKLLTATEEVQLSRKVQDLLALEAIRSSLREQLGREPALIEWAGAVDMAVGSFSSRLHEGRQSKDRMIQSNLRLVVSVANKYQGKGMSFEDLVQAGHIGLIRGCEKFNPDKGFKFSTYAHYWIRQVITRRITQQARTVRIPIHLCDTRSRIQNAKRKLFHKYQRPPREEDVAKVLGITVERLQTISKSFKNCRSLDKLVGKDKNMNMGEFIADETSEHPESMIERHFFKQDLNKLLETLSEKEMNVVRLRFGLEGGIARTLQAVGNKYNLTRERVRQIEIDAIQKLKQSDRNKVLKEYIYM